MGIIIYPPTINWSWMKQRPQHLMYQLAKHGHMVFYCNQTQTLQDVEQIHPNLFVVHDHEKWVTNELPIIRRQYSSVGIWCSYPKLAPTLPLYKSDWIIYDCIDDFADWALYENKMVSISDAIICSSSRLFSRLKQTYPNKLVVLVRNAYDVEMKLHEDHPFVMPSDLAPLTHKTIIGYIGAWAPWVDEKLIKNLSKIDSNIAVVVIGPEFGKKYLNTDSSSLHFFGLKHHYELPNYFRYISIFLIPFRITNVTLATNPIKAYEYLATGKPVVSTNLPECRMMEPHVDIAQTHKDFIELVKKRINDPGDPHPRIDYALNNTWGARYEQISEVLTNLKRN